MLREQFAAIVSHELKAPLGAVQQNLFALEHELQDMLTDEQASKMERMKSSIDNLLKLIHTWLRLISSDIGKIREQFVPISIEDVITEAVESIEPHAVRKDITISTTVEAEIPPINGDVVTLREAIVNLLSNAIKYSRIETQIRVNTRTEGDEVVISVADRGVGIAEEDLPFIFGDFYVGQSAPPSERGVGLGLAITRRIVEAHDGTISVESALEKGSTFIIRLPISERKKDISSSVQADTVAKSA
jgi:signal transduction histidine kinase